MTEPKGFQIVASSEICDKLFEYLEDPLMKTKYIQRPFYQNLSAITGSGKTLILAEFLAKLKIKLPIAPVVLWLSKGKVVVWQTYENLYTGKYSDNINGYNVKKLLECTEDDIRSDDIPLLLVATVAKINQSDIENSDRKVFEVQLDKASDSLWNLLKERKTSKGIKRDLIIVYDEGHNLSDQQTQLFLEELQPTALITASATMKLPHEMEDLIKLLKKDKGWTERDLQTTVSSSDVVDSQLIKKGIELNGYNTQMEIAIDEMLVKIEEIKEIIRKEKLSINPKAIYVTNTNTIMHTKYNDKTNIPFLDRKARPIVIWRYLVSKGIDPNDIAVYCNLKFDTKYPKPSNFHLFSGGDKDYDNFIKGNYKHIIFNLSLQEGWDDPECYCAYIDKDMGSKVQISQVIGRVLRQPDATHYSYDELNLCYFYIRSDESNTFKDVIEEIQNKIIKDIPDLDITFTSPSGEKNKTKIAPKLEKLLPEIVIDTSIAKNRINKIINKIPDYRSDQINTKGKGNKMKMLQYIAEDSKNCDLKVSWVDVNNNNKVAARWILISELDKYYMKIRNICDLEQPKFDALIEIGSIAAANLRDFANKIIHEYVKYSKICVLHDSSEFVKPIHVNINEMIKFNNGVHEGYSGFNDLEKRFAVQLDQFEFPWFRNKDVGFFSIPLLGINDTDNFNPDFVVWTDQDIIVIDTKGDHILAKDKDKKLFSLKNIGSGPNVKIRLVSEGKWRNENEKISKNGFTVWLMKSGRVEPFSSDTLEESISLCLDSEWD